MFADFDPDVMFGASPTQTDSVHADVLCASDWPSSTFPLSQDFSGSTLNGLDFDNQVSFLQMDFSSMEPGTHPEPFPNLVNQPQFREDASNRSSRTSNLLFDHTPDLPPPSTRGATGTVTRYGQTFELLEPESEINCIRKLTQLSIGLFEHSNTLPPLSICDSPPDNIEEDSVYLGAKDYSNYVVEDTFRLIQSLIDIYLPFLNAFLPHPTTKFSSGNTTWPHEGMSNARFQVSQHPAPGTASSSQASSRSPLDHSSILVILACHMRVIDIYEALSHHMRACFKQQGIARTHQQTLMNTPQLKIGSYAPPSSAAIPMQMLLLVQFASQLFSYSTDLASALGESEGVTPRSDSSDFSASDDTFAMTRAVVENVKSRASSMSQEMGAIRVLMFNSGMLA
jgi:hypothetical protein